MENWLVPKNLAIREAGLKEADKFILAISKSYPSHVMVRR
jgi:hypothetical protein